MKKITLFIAFAFLFMLKSNAQVSSYSFAQSNGSYSEFTDGTVLGTATGNATGTPSLDNEVYTVTLPFSFIFNGSSFTSCNVSSNGFITFNTTAPAATLYTPISSTDVYSGSISAWGGNINALFDLGGLTGDIQWKEIGTAPNRELVVQYRNFRPTSSTSTTTAPYINFQIRLSETTNQIKFVYGSSGLAVGTTNTSTTKQIGLRGETNNDFNNRTNATTVLFTASTPGTLNTNTQAYSSVNATPGVPSNGLTYTWTPPTCLAPLSTTVSNITTTTATISWLATVTVPSGGYEYYYSTSNVAPTGAGIATSNLTENLTGLSESSNYFLWMRSNCGSGDYSGWVGPVLFSTVCVSVTSFSQNFDGVAASTFPACWGKVGTTGTTNLQTTSPSSAPNTLYIYSSSATARAVVKTLPVSNLGAGTHRLKMQMRANFTVGGVVEIGYLTDVADAASFVPLGNVTAASLAYQEYSFVPAAGTYTDNLALRPTGVPANSVLIDDVVWEAIPAIVPNCSVVSTPANGSTNQNVATNLTWSANGNATGYKLSIGTTSGGTDILNNVDLGNVTSYNPPTDFAYNTLYYINLIAYNSTGDATGCTETSFTTSTPPPANDDSTGAIALTVNPDLACAVTTTGTTISATASTEAAPSCSATGINDDVWYMFTATNTAHRFVYSAVTTGTMATALYTGTPGSLVQLTGACFSSTSQDFVGLTVGTTYYARVYTTSATVTLTTNFTVCLGTMPAAPANDEPSGAVALTINADLACAVTTTGTTISATPSTETAPTCSATGINDDVWYTFTATDVVHRFVYSGTTTGTMATALYTGTPGSLVQLTGACLSGNSQDFPGLTVGTSYYARVYTTSATVSTITDFTVCLGTLPPSPANDEPSGAVALTVNADLACAVTTDGTTISASASTETVPSCSPTGINDDVWYTFTAANVVQRFVYSGVTTGTMATVLYTGTPGSLVQLTGACLTGNVQDFAGLTVGTTYYARVYTTVATFSTTTNFTVCIGTLPPIPANDSCTTATVVSALPYSFTQDATSATNNTGFISTCASGMNDGIWYTFNVATTGDVTIVVSGVTGWDPEVGVYSGSCGTFTCAGSVDVGGLSVNETLNLTALAPGQYWINIGHYNGTTNNLEGPLTIGITGTAVLLGTNSFDNANFSYYPNPVKNTLNLSYTQNISDVAVYNLLGQQVIAKTINANQSQVDMSHLSSGAYMVKVTADNQVKMIKVIKE